MSIQQWPESERPREKLLKRGADSLSDAELLAIFLRTGSQGMNAVELAREMITQFGSLYALINADQKDMLKLKGIGPTKYIQIQAAIELGQRYLESSLLKQDCLNSPDMTRRYLKSRLYGYAHEVFACLFLDNRNHIIQFDEMFHGTINSASVYPREIVKRALSHNAAAIIFAHNHPSGISEPSQADIQLTKRLVEALDVIDVRVLDHFVIGNGEAVSFSERGLL